MKKWKVAMYAIRSMETDKKVLEENGCHAMAQLLDNIKRTLFESVDWKREDEAHPQFIEMLAQYALDGAVELLSDSEKTGLKDTHTKAWRMTIEDDICFLKSFIASH